jgi:hypothetical protein
VTQKNALPAKFKMVENEVIKNPKFEARNPKQILNSNVPTIKTTAEFNLIITTILFGSFEFW